MDEFQGRFLYLEARTRRTEVGTGSNAGDVELHTNAAHQGPTTGKGQS